MNALLIVLAVLLALAFAHPAAAAVVLGAEAALVVVVGRLVWRAPSLRLYPCWRTA